MTYKEYKKTVAKKYGITLYALEKGIRDGQYSLTFTASDLRILKTCWSHNKEYIADVIAEEIAFDVEHLDIVIGKGAVK
jgi:hypothetical protein